MAPRPEPSGREPTEARSARGLRVVYASIAAVVGTAAGIWLWSIRPPDGTAFAVAALSCFLVAAVSATDLALLLIRRRTTRGSGPRR